MAFGFVEFTEQVDIGEGRTVSFVRPQPSDDHGPLVDGYLYFPCCADNQLTISGIRLLLNTALSLITAIA